MPTVTIQIGNSDNKLTQKEWARFINEALKEISDIWSNKIHFSGGSSAESPWQNYCWVVECDASRINDLKESLSILGKQFNQDSVAFTTGETEFV
jgi:hypothetical protein